MGWLTTSSPVQVTRQGKGTRQLTILVPLKKMAAADSNIYLQYLRVKNPSRRLSLIMEIFWESKPGNLNEGAIINATNNVWDLIAMAEGIVQGGSYLNSLLDGESLPFAYEVDTGVRLFYMAVQQQAAALAGPVYLPGGWYLRCRWEPNMPIDNDELQKLFDQCDVAPPVDG